MNARKKPTLVLMRLFSTFLYFHLSKLEKSKFHIQQLEGDVVKCREQIARSEEECRSAQRELKRLHTDADDQRDALVNEVRKLNKQVTSRLLV